MVGNRDLREHLNELWKTTVDQFDEIKDVILRNSHVGRKKLDTAFLRRQRDRLLQDLGESVFEQVQASTLVLNPEGQRLVERVHEVLGQIETEEAEISRLAKLGSPETGHDDEPTQQTQALDADGQPVARAAAAAEGEMETADGAGKDGASAVDAVAATGDIEDPEGAAAPRRRRRRRRRTKKDEAGAESGPEDDET
ncbi:MAG: hypothetical protein ABIJ09_09075 [Pseudomonadota bacterium]